MFSAVGADVAIGIARFRDAIMIFYNSLIEAFWRALRKYVYIFLMSKAFTRISGLDCMRVLDNFAVKFLFRAKKYQRQKNQCFRVSLEMKFKSVFLCGACVGSCCAAIGSIQYLTNKMDT